MPDIIKAPASCEKVNPAAAVLKNAAAVIECAPANGILYIKANIRFNNPPMTYTDVNQAISSALDKPAVPAA